MPLDSLFAAIACAQNLDSATRELAQKIEGVAHGKDIGALTVRNVSSLPEADAAQVRRLLETELRGRPARVGSERITAQVTLSENIHSYLWVALISDASKQDVVMLSVERPTAPATAPLSLSIQKKLVWEQERPILDAEVSGDYLIVLEPSAVFFYRSGQLTQSLPISSARPMPRDPRGRLTIEGDSFRALVPDVACSGTITPAPVMVCAESSAWPFGAGTKLFLRAGAGSIFFLRYAAGKTIARGPRWAHARLRPALPGRSANGPDGAATSPRWTRAAARPRVVLASKPGDATEADEIQIYNVVDHAAMPIGEAAPFTGSGDGIVGRRPSAGKRRRSRGIRRRDDYAAYSLAINCDR